MIIVILQCCFVYGARSRPGGGRRVTRKPKTMTVIVYENRSRPVNRDN